MYHYQMNAFVTVIEWHSGILRKFLDKIYLSLYTGHYEPVPELSRRIVDAVAEIGLLSVSQRPSYTVSYL